MNVTISGSVTHRCPFVDEVDAGTVELTYTYLAQAEVIELHALRAFLATFHDKAMTHEQVTDAIAAQYPHAIVVTTWRTANMDVTCRA